MARKNLSQESLAEASRYRAKFSGHRNAKGAAGYISDTDDDSYSFLGSTGQLEIFNPQEGGFGKIVIEANGISKGYDDRLLIEQVTGRVRWRESMEWMAGEGGVTRFAEIGSGKVLTGMAKRIAPDAESLSLNTPDELEAFAKSL